LPVLVLFVLIPLVDIALVIVIGGKIGVPATLALLILSALTGVSILRGQHFRVVAVMQGALRVEPGTFLAEGAFRALAGMLLILPGFLGDVLGLVLLVPSVQRAIVRGIAARATVVTSTRVYRDADVFEGDFSVREAPQDPQDLQEAPRRLDDHRP